LRDKEQIIENKEDDDDSEHVYKSDDEEAENPKEVDFQRQTKVEAAPNG